MKGISKSFPGVQALKGVQLRVRPGEVHALMGENGAGKSTLMKCLFGIYQKDEGEILFQGQSVDFANPSQALRAGVAMVQQELEQVPHQNVMDNIWLGRYPHKGPFVRDKEMYEKTVAVIRDFNMNIDPRTRINQLSVSMKQMVDIIKAVSYHARIIVFDEPTSSLTERETEALFEIIRRLKRDGCGIIYISHKIDEVLTIADRVTVMRDGMWVATEDTKDMSTETLIRLMVNREMENRFPPKHNTIGDVVLQVEDLQTFYPPHLNKVSFEARAGEILGIGGLVGSGRSELLESILGLRKLAGGKIRVRGKEIRSNRDARENRIAMVTEERRETGIFPLLDIRWNTVASSLKKNVNKLGFVSLAKVRENTQWAIDTLRVKTASQRTLIRNLSGGNQQKVLLGRCLLQEPDILLLDEPTRGIDVGAKYEIYQLMIQLAQQGKTIIFVSSEMPELLGLADRILVMSNARNAGILDGETATQEEILKLATRYVGDEPKMPVVGPRNPEDNRNFHYVHKTTLPVNGSVGEHPHEGNEQFYLIVEGEGEVTLCGKVFPVKPWSIALIRSGGSHGIRNTGDKPLVYLCVETGLTGQE